MEHVSSIEGSPAPADIYQPHMPVVELLSDMDAFFAIARSQAVHDESPIGKNVKGQRTVVIVTPGRLIMSEPCPAPGSMSDAEVAPMINLLPPDSPLKVSVISYTNLEAFMEDQTKSKCIPFLGYLMGLAYIGHSVVVFEGHESAFESGLRDCDVLFVDSGMLPFIQSNWVEAAEKVMSPNPKIFVFNRDNFAIMPVARSNNAKGWQYTEYDGEVSYANCLLTTLARGGGPTATITSGRGVPDLSQLTTNPEDLDWIGGLPFKYGKLNADKVIKVILTVAGWKWYHFFKKTGVFQVRLATGQNELKPITFFLTLTKDAEGRRQLLIES